MRITVVSGILILAIVLALIINTRYPLLAFLVLIVALIAEAYSVTKDRKEP